MSELQHFLEHTAYILRVWSLRMTTAAGSGHPTSALSAADIVAALFFYAMRFDPQDPHNLSHDQLILSKGHAVPVVYAAWHQLGILSEKELLSYRQFDSVLEGHPTPRFDRNPAATGSLGQGLSIALGAALAARMAKRDTYFYVLLGDSEIAEGSVWEAANLAGYYKTDHLIAWLDANHLGQSTEPIGAADSHVYAQKFAAFGWHTLSINGHAMSEIMQACDAAKKVRNKPTIIIANTIKGYGLSGIEGKPGFHGKAFSSHELPRLLHTMQERFSSVANKPSYQWKPTVPPSCTVPAQPVLQFPQPTYKKGEMIATRKAYGQALVTVARLMPDVVCLDAEVKNSTYAELFFKEFPERFIESFVAEQNMVGMAVGCLLQGKIPFASTFAVFFSRAFDQIRMAGIGRAPVRLCGSHAGVSIGQDGPSQMGLEDIALMRSVLYAVIVYPCDAVSTYYLAQCMATYHEGISYMRTTRAETPVIYDSHTKFHIGGSHILRKSSQDRVCIVAAGITLHEALKAYDLLQHEGISVCVVDAYSIQPLDVRTLEQEGRQVPHGIITVEDHYKAGGLGEAVSYALRNTGIHIECLAVTQLPRSGMPDELLAYEGIDADALVAHVKSLQNT